MNVLIYSAIFLCSRVTIGSWQHIIPVFAAFVFGYLIITFAKNNLKPKMFEDSQKQCVYRQWCLFRKYIHRQYLLRTVAHPKTQHRQPAPRNSTQ